MRKFCIDTPELEFSCSSNPQIIVHAIVERLIQVPHAFDYTSSDETRWLADKARFK
ncbi:MAG: hypothetical protein NVS9B9_28770 [Ktedonobacteraceae bacterium]